MVENHTPVGRGPDQRSEVTGRWSLRLCQALINGPLLPGGTVVTLLPVGVEQVANLHNWWWDHDFDEQITEPSLTGSSARTPFRGTQPGTWCSATR